MNPKLEPIVAEMKTRIGGVSSPRIAEVGVADGQLSEAIVAAFPGVRLTMVDNWRPGSQRPEEYRATGDKIAQWSPEDALAHELAALDVATRLCCSIVKADSAHAAGRFEHGEFDLVYIDADHSYAGVARDVDAWRWKVRRGGWLSGHDYENNRNPKFDASGVKRAVDEAFPDGVETGEWFTWWVRM